MEVRVSLYCTITLFWTEYDDLKNKQDIEYSEDSRQSQFFFPTKLSIQKINKINKKLSFLFFIFFQFLLDR